MDVRLRLGIIMILDRGIQKEQIPQGVLFYCQSAITSDFLFSLPDNNTQNQN